MTKNLNNCALSSTIKSLQNSLDCIKKIANNHLERERLNYIANNMEKCVACLQEIKLGSNNVKNYFPESNEELKKIILKDSIKLSEIDVSALDDLSGVFKNSKRIDFAGIENWDVSNVINMNRMFAGAIHFNQPLENWDVSNVTDMGYMFQGAISFNQPLEKWDVSNVTNMEHMFAADEMANDCRMIFNQPLSKWNISNVKNMFAMFFSNRCFNQPLDNWKISQETNIKRMFEGSGQKPLPNWFTKKDTK